MVDNTIDTDWMAVTAEQVAEADTADLVPTGTYEGLVTDVKPRTVEKIDSPVYGAKMARLTVDLYDVAGRTRKHFFDVSPGLVKPDGTLRGEGKLAAQLAKHTGTIGAPFSETLEKSKITRLKFRVRLAEAKNGYEARNWTDAITSAI